MTLIPGARRTVRALIRGFLRTGAVTLALAVSLAAGASGQTYYVDNQSATCSSAGPGTEAEPYCTIGAAVTALAGPGVTIIVKPGVYREQVNVPASGAAGFPFAIRASAAGVVIDGADDLADPGLWAGDVVLLRGDRKPDMGTVWIASNVTWNPHQVFVDGARLNPFAGTPDLLPENAFTWMAGEGLYVNLGGDNPGARQTLVGRRENGFVLSAKSWVTIEGFEITRTEGRSIHIQNGCSDLVIARNRVSFGNSYGIKCFNGSRVLIEENIVSDCNYHGIGLVSGSTGCVLRNNESFRNAQPGIRAAKGVYLSAAPNNTLVGNRLHHNQDSGVQINSGSNDCLVYNNQSWRNGDHGFDHLDVSGTLHLNNVAYGNYKDGFSIEADSPNTQLHNCIAAENGLATDEFDLWVNLPSSVGFVSDHNIFWKSTSQHPIKYIATQYLWLTDYQAASGQDAHSLQADPMFVDPGTGNFALRPGSPAIDAGTSAVAYWPATDAAGNARLDDSGTPDSGEGPVSFVDIGAFEFLSPAGTEPVGRLTPDRTEADGAKAHDQDAPLVGAQGMGIPVLALSSGYPNPSRGAVEFALDLPQASQVEWTVYDLQGRMVWSEGRALGAGRARLRWDGATSGRERAPTGVYLVRARVAGREFTRRVVRF